MPVRSIITAVLVAGVLVLLAFGPRTGAPAPAGRIVVEYWDTWTGAEMAAMQQTVDDFNRSVGAEKHIFVHFLSQSDISQKTLLAAAANVPPDIAGLWDKPLPQWAALGALEPLDDLAAARGFSEGYYKPIYWKGLHYNGHLYALLSTPNVVALLWNKRIFLEHAAALRAAGLDPARAPRTLSELDQYAGILNQFDSTDPKKPILLSAGYLPTEPGWYLEQTPLWFGGNLYDEKTGRFTLDSPETLAAFRWIASYSRKLTPGVVNEFHAALGTYGTPANPFLTGQLVMEQQGPWVQTVIEQFKPEMNRWQPGETRPDRAEWSVAPFPSSLTANAASDDARVDNAVTWCGFNCLAIPRGARHKAEAFEFIAYVNRMDVMEKLCAAHCKNTPLAQHSASWYSDHPNPNAEIFDRLASSPNARTAPPVAVWPEAVDEIKAAVLRVANLEQTPEDAVTSLQQSLQGKLDQFRARHPE